MACAVFVCLFCRCNGLTNQLWNLATQPRFSTLMNSAAFFNNVEMLSYLKRKGANMNLKGKVRYSGTMLRVGHQ